MLFSLSSESSSDSKDSKVRSKHQYENKFTSISQMDLKSFHSSENIVVAVTDEFTN